MRRRPTTTIETVAMVLEATALAMATADRMRTSARSCVRWWRTFSEMMVVTTEATRASLEADASSTRSAVSNSGSRLSSNVSGPRPTSKS